MINISYNVVAKEGSSIRTASGLYGINSVLNDNTKPSSSTVQSDNIKAITVTTNYLTVSSAAYIPTLNASTITSDSINSTNANLTYITTYSVEATKANIDSVTSLDADIKNIISERISVKDLDVTGSAHFFELVIDKIRSAGGQMIFSAGDGFTVDKVEYIDTSCYLYWRADDGEKAISNTMQTYDLIVCRNFNEAQIGTNTNINNKYYWCPVAYSSTQPVLIDGNYYHYVVVDVNSSYDGVLNPEIGDEISMLGNTHDKSRQSAIYIAAGESSLDSGLQPPLLAQYQGIDGSHWDLKYFRKSFFDRTSATFIGNFNITTSDGEKDIKDYINDEIGGISIEGVKGDDGISSYNIVFDNQMTNVPCDYLGQLIGNTNNQFYTINAQLYYGATAINPSDISNVNVTTLKGIAFDTPSYTSITSTGVSINMLDGMINDGGDCQSFLLTVTLNNNYNSTEVKDTFYVNKIKAGENGVTSPIYEFSTSTPYVKVNKSGNIIYPSDGIISFSVNKIYNNEVTQITSIPDGYRIIDENGTQINITGIYSQYASTEHKFNYSLYKGDVLVDYIEFPILFDGIDGINGSNGKDGINGNNGKDGVSYHLNMSEFAATMDRNGEVNFIANGNPTYTIGSNTYNMTNYAIRWSTNGELSGSYNPSGSSSNTFNISEYLGNYKNSPSAIGTALMIELRKGSASGDVVRTETTNILFQPSASLLIDSDLNTINATVQGNTTAINDNYNTLSNEISSLQISMSGIVSDVSSIETNVDKQSEQIAYIQNNYSTIKQTSEQIQSTVGKMIVGGENILDRTEFVSMSAMTNSDVSVTAKYDYTYRDINGATIYVSPASDNMYDTYTNVLVMDAQDGTLSSSASPYMDVLQTVTGKIKPNTNYVLHFKYRGYYVEHPNNNLNSAGVIYLTNTNSTWIETDGVTQTVLYTDLMTKLGGTDNKWVTKTIKFKTGETIGSVCQLYLRTMIGSEIQICQLKLEEGTMPTAWCVSQKDVSSQITQSADSISLEIKNGLESTGIHIDEHYITLDGNTRIDGELSIKNSYGNAEAIKWYKEQSGGNVLRGQIISDSIKDYDTFKSQTDKLFHGSVSQDVSDGQYLGNNKYRMGYNYSTNVKQVYEIGSCNEGQTISINEITISHSITSSVVSITDCKLHVYRLIPDEVGYNTLELESTINISKTGSITNGHFILQPMEYTVMTSNMYGLVLEYVAKTTKTSDSLTTFFMGTITSDRLITIGHNGMTFNFGLGKYLYIDSSTTEIQHNNINTSYTDVYKYGGLKIGNNEMPMTHGNDYATGMIKDNSDGTGAITQKGHWCPVKYDQICNLNEIKPSGANIHLLMHGIDVYVFNSTKTQTLYIGSETAPYTPNPVSKGHMIAGQRITVINLSGNLNVKGYIIKQNGLVTTNYEILAGVPKSFIYIGLQSIGGNNYHTWLEL